MNVREAELAAVESEVLKRIEFPGLDEHIASVLVAQKLTHELILEYDLQAGDLAMLGLPLGDIIRLKHWIEVAKVSAAAAVSSVPPDERQIFTKMKINVTDIDAAQQTFTADFLLWATFKTLVPDVSEADSLEEVDSLESLRIYPFDVQFITPHPPEELSTKFLVNRHTGEVFSKCNWLVTSNQPLDLHAFPFDVQTLNIRFRVRGNILPWDKEVSTCQELATPPSPFTLRMTRIAQQWTHVGSLNNACFEVSHKNEIDKRVELGVKVMLRRAAEHYVINYFGMNAAVMIVNVMTPFIPHNDIGDRFGYLVTLLLAVFAFKSLVTDKIPALPYNTTLDWALFATILTVIIAMVESAIVVGLPTATAVWVDVIVFSTFVLLGVIGNFAIWREYSNSKSHDTSQAAASKSASSWMQEGSWCYCGDEGKLGSPLWGGVRV